MRSFGEMNKVCYISERGGRKQLVFSLAFESPEVSMFGKLVGLIFSNCHQDLTGCCWVNVRKTKQKGSHSSHVRHP